MSSVSCFWSAKANLIDSDDLRRMGHCPLPVGMQPGGTFPYEVDQSDARWERVDLPIKGQHPDAVSFRRGIGNPAHAYLPPFCGDSRGPILVTAGKPDTIR